MKRKIIFNILTAFVLLPIILHICISLPDIILGKIDSHVFFRKMISMFDYNKYGIEEFIILVIVLMPFQIIKDRNWRKGKKRSFWWRWLVASGLFGMPILIMWILIPYMWFIEYGNFMYILLCLGVGLGINTFLYFTIDRYEEKKEPYDNRLFKLSPDTWRKIIFNPLAAMIFVPIFYIMEMSFYLKPFFTNEALAAMPRIIFKHIFEFEEYGIPELILIAAALVPFQLIKDSARRGSKVYSFWNKFLILTGFIFIIIFAAYLFTPYMHKDSVYLNYIVLGLIMSLLVNTFLYFTIDRHVGNRPDLIADQEQVILNGA